MKTIKKFYVKYGKERKQMKYAFNDLKNKGLIFRRKHIIKALRKRNELMRKDGIYYTKLWK